jgi:hypothetical protein
MNAKISRDVGDRPLALSPTEVKAMASRADGFCRWLWRSASNGQKRVT